ncbi:precorrin-2 C(20)-methyltransferase [Methanobacterium paludis]|uniref:Precorrin-2 C20-methyltransferase n=1 Tax=Methanobacterium paludis (strain DSM 25820 / JCM 18151 / SWAN1) TaxID=868131 RepID=F6D5Z2_METPW|nr:precorrin-2 C(20)-methyltransferase [Methanobacterium paludis]AEG19362.1 precorrin-2 C20-methyltransferase [Methanobacterium paludis]
MKRGKLIGIGVGPGNTELLTVKAVKALQSVEVICAPRSASSKPSLALSIVQPVLDDRDDEYETLEPLFPMIEDKNALEGYWDDAAGVMAQKLEDGKNLAFITLGDPMVYSTFSYVCKRITAMDFDVEIIPGVTSFTGCAATAGIPIAEKDEIIVIVPKVDERLEKIMEYGDTFVIMKTSRHSEELEKIVAHDKRDKDVISVQNCSMKDEKVFKGFSKDKKYLSTTIVKFKDE